MAIELVNADEAESVEKDRAVRTAWLNERDYRVVAVKSADVESELTAVLESIARGMA